MKVSGLEMVHMTGDWNGGAFYVACMCCGDILSGMLLCLMIILGGWFCSYILSDVATRYTRSQRRFLVYRSLLHERIWISWSIKTCCTRLSHGSPDTVNYCLLNHHSNNIPVFVCSDYHLIKTTSPVSNV